MAGSASNWFRPSGGPYAGQAVYISKENRMTTYGNKPLSRGLILNVLSRMPGRAQPWIDKSQRPAGAAKSGSASVAGGRNNALAHSDYGNQSVIIEAREAQVMGSANSLAVVKGRAQGTYDLVDVHAGRTLQHGMDLDSATRQMQAQAASAPRSHVLDSLDAEGRATRTIRPAKTLATSLDDVLDTLPTIREAFQRIGSDEARLTYAGGPRGDVILAAIQQHHGYDQLPAKVSRTDLDRMLESGEVSTVMYRGAGGYEQEFIDKTFFGAGDNGRLMGAGAYTASVGGKAQPYLDDAREYVENYIIPGSGKMLRMGLRPDAKIISERDLTQERLDWANNERRRLADDRSMNKIDADEYDFRDRMINVIEGDAGYYAALAGYDGIERAYGVRGANPPRTSFMGISILNRSAVIVQDELELPSS